MLPVFDICVITFSVVPSVLLFIDLAYSVYHYLNLK